MKKFQLLLVDIQNDFHDDGSLPVEGAKENAKTVIETIIKPYMQQIDGITVSLDTHEIVDFAHKWFWIADDTMNDKYTSNFPNNPPQPKHPPNFSQIHFFNTDAHIEIDNNSIKTGEKVFFGTCTGYDLKEQLSKEGYKVPSSSLTTEIDQDELKRYNGIKDEEEYHFYWKPADAGLRKYCEKYFIELQKNTNEISSDSRSKSHERISTNISSKVSEKLSHIIWPDHCLQGSHGQCVYKEYHDTLIKWSEMNQKDVYYVLKGSNPLCEMYSAIRAEVPVDGDVTTFPNISLLKYFFNTTNRPDMLGLVVAGQAITHTVRYTVHDILKYWLAAEEEADREKKKFNAQLQSWKWSDDFVNSTNGGAGLGDSGATSERRGSNIYKDTAENAIELLDPLDEKFIFNGHLYLLQDACGYVQPRSRKKAAAIRKDTDEWINKIKKIDGVEVIECKELASLLNQ